MVEVVALTKKVAKDNLEALIKIDQEVLDEHGNTFSDEKWDGVHFLKDLKGKWEFSCVAMAAGGIFGYCICSLLNEDTVYINRIAVSPPYQNRGIGRKMIEYLVNKCLEKEKSSIMLEVNVKNQFALTFYSELDFRKITGRDLKDYLIQRNKFDEKQKYEDYFIEKGYLDKKHVFKKDIEQNRRM